MKILHLTLKKRWFDMILSGEKKEEYREVKDYWMKRLSNLKGCGTSYNFTILNNSGYPTIDFDFIEFKNGYKKDAPTILVECKAITVGQGKKKWGAPDYKVYIITLGTVLQTNVEFIKKDLDWESKIDRITVNL